MMNAIENPLEHLVLPHVSWNTFERLIDEMGNVRLRVSYLNGQLEFVRPDLGHHACVQGLSRLIFLTAFETKTPLCTGGSTTLKLPTHQACIEPDACFWIKNEAKMRGKKQWIARNNPPPDLALEIDIAYTCLDRLEIYAALNVPEIWRLDGKNLKVHVLGANGKYRSRLRSVAFPTLPMDGFVRFVKLLDSDDELILARQFTEWLRSNVVPETAGREPKNGRR